MIDPKCRILLKKLTAGAPEAYREEWQKEGVRLYADFDCSDKSGTSTRAGLFFMDGRKRIQQNTVRGSKISAEQEKMSMTDIAVMDWLNENIDGEL